MWPDDEGWKFLLTMSSRADRTTQQTLNLIKIQSCNLKKWIIFMKMFTTMAARALVITTTLFFQTLFLQKTILLLFYKIARQTEVRQKWYSLCFHHGLLDCRKPTIVCRETNASKFSHHSTISSAFFSNQTLGKYFNKVVLITAVCVFFSQYAYVIQEKKELVLTTNTMLSFRSMEKLL